MTLQDLKKPISSQAIKKAIMEPDKLTGLEIAQLMRFRSPA